MNKASLMKEVFELGFIDNGTKAIAEGDPFYRVERLSADGISFALALLSYLCTY
jgi:hypothetical protein